MTLTQMERQLVILEERLRGLLEEDGRRALAIAKSDLRRARPKWEGEKRNRRNKASIWHWFWSLSIERGTPLRFIETEAKNDIGSRMVVDLSCRLSELRDGRPLGKHGLLLRIWSPDESVWFREEKDAPEVRDGVLRGMGRRVMLRCHFDFEKDEHAGPRHHLQVGGVPLPEEYSWFHPNINQPRFAHHPMGLVMACELVVRTFFPDHVTAVCGEGTWKGALAAEQEEYLSRYYADQAVSAPAGTLNTSLLGRLWNR